jgi:tetratricopeptide (TPR) repeat protein
MSGEKSTDTAFSSSEAAITTTTASSDNTRTRQRIVQNFLLIWLDTKLDQSKKECQNIVVQLRNVINEVIIFTERDECIDFLTDVRDMKIFLIIEGALCQQILPLIHDIPQLDAVYILCKNKSRYEQWAEAWIKVKGVHTEITPICESLQQVVQQCNQNSIALSFVTVGEGASNQNLNQLEPSFMYTQIFKEILLDMKYEEQSIRDFTAYCRNGWHGSSSNITRFENEYNAKSAIWWYTYPSFISSLLNDALRWLESDTIIKMGFFIHDLHRQIEKLHRKQVHNYRGKSFVVYRGQGLSTADFEKLLKTKGGLMSFNNFLSTSQRLDVSLDFARIALTTDDTVGIVFEMFIDPSVSSTPFAAIQNVSYFNTEQEILFSMHTVFRIGEIKRIHKDNPLYQVELRLTSDDDGELRTLTERIREEATGLTGWGRLGNLLLKIGHSDKAEELYKVLLEQTCNESEKALYYNQLGYIKDDQAEYEKAIRYYEKALEIRQKILPPNHPSLATSYNNIAVVYKNVGEYSKALSFYEKALEIREKTLPPNHPDLSSSYNNIGLVYQNMGDYSRAFSFYNRAQEIYQKSLPPNHPLLASSYDNIGAVSYNMGEYSKALSDHEKALEIRQKTLPPNHPDLATSYNNIATVYDNMGEYSKALSFYEKALEIQQKTHPENHPWLAISYNNIGLVYKHIGEYTKALLYYEKALGVKQKTLPENHPDLATAYNNIGWVYSSLQHYSRALSFFERALDICRRSLPPNHPNLQNVQKGIESVKKKL